MKFVKTLLLFATTILAVPCDAQQNIRLDPLSITSLLLETRSGNAPIGTATGFIVEHRAKHYLISSVHVFSGIDSFSGKPRDPQGRTPDQIRIWHHREKLQGWAGPIEKLRNDDGSPRWIQLNEKFDVAALPITELTEKISLYPLDLGLANSDVLATVGMQAFIIGFPGGLSSIGAVTAKEARIKAGIHPPGFPIWKSVHIATDPDIDYDLLPVFLVDGTTRAGMSGSPVVLRPIGAHPDKQGNLVTQLGGRRDLFLGVYSAQYPQLELGYVWKAKLVSDLLGKIK